MIDIPWCGLPACEAAVEGADQRVDAQRAHARARRAVRRVRRTRDGPSVFCAERTSRIAAAALGGRAARDEPRRARRRRTREPKRRAAGGDRATALRVAERLLVRPLPVQLTKVRCERYAAERYCGLDALRA